MLEPNVRENLIQALRPPPEYDVSYAAGTTYTLDLMTLLVVPLAFALLEVGEEERDRTDPLALLDALRRYADRVDLFCQGGGIHLPKGPARFFHYLEERVHEVQAPRTGGLFHPKVWAIRFQPLREGLPPLYRLMVLSRNLTFDKSWDTMLCLEGIGGRPSRKRMNRPLAQFFESLPGMMLHASERVNSDLNQLAEELRHVDFELPPGFEEMQFLPFGIPAAKEIPLPAPHRHRLLLAPFVDAGGLRELQSNLGNDILISREESLRALPRDLLDACGPCYFLDPDADPEMEEESDGRLRGLHAKLFVFNEGWDAKVWTGSANATGAALHRNVEFMVELTGKNKHCGIEALMDGAKGKSALSDLLVPFQPSDDELETDPELDLDSARSRISMAVAAAGGRIHVSEVDSEGLYDIHITFEKEIVVPEIELREFRCRPITRPAGSELSLSELREVTFPASSFESLSTFILFEVKGLFREKDQITATFVLNIPAEGMPEDRKERHLRNMLKDRNEVTRFLLYLMAEDGAPPPTWSTSSTGSQDGSESFRPFGGDSLLEPVLRCLHDHPEKLDRVAEVVKNLQASGEGETLLPEGFEDLWNQVMRLRDKGKS